MAWLPYLEDSSERLPMSNIVTAISDILALLESNEQQLILLNARIEEAFNTGINEEDVT